MVRKARRKGSAAEVLARCYRARLYKHADGWRLTVCPVDPAADIQGNDPNGSPWRYGFEITVALFEKAIGDVGQFADGVSHGDNGFAYTWSSEPPKLAVAPVDERR
jgi:hypothetical protein